MASPILNRLLGGVNRESVVDSLMIKSPICQVIKGLQTAQNNFLTVKDYSKPTLVGLLIEIRDAIDKKNVFRAPGIIRASETLESFFAIYGFSPDAPYHVGNIYAHASDYGYLLPAYARMDKCFASALVHTITARWIAHEMERRKLITEMEVLSIYRQ